MMKQFYKRLLDTSRTQQTPPMNRSSLLPYATGYHLDVIGSALQVERAWTGLPTLAADEAYRRQIYERLEVELLAIHDASYEAPSGYTVEGWVWRLGAWLGLKIDTAKGELWGGLLYRSMKHVEQVLGREPIDLSRVL